MNSGSAIVLVVTGPPASGKSTVAAGLARALGWPLFAKDDIKERLFDALGSGDRDWSRRLSAASYDVQFEVATRCLDAGTSVVLEGNFRPTHALRLSAIAVDHHAQCAQVLCIAEAAVLQDRLRARGIDATRHPGHLDTELIAELPQLVAASARALELEGPVLRLDTTCGMPGSDDARLVEFAQRLRHIEAVTRVRQN
jgi:predicted kinase